MKRCRADYSRFCGPYNPMVPQRTISTYLMPMSAFATPPTSQARGVHLGSAIGARIRDTSPDPTIHSTSRWENFGSRFLEIRSRRPSYKGRALALKYGVLSPKADIGFAGEVQPRSRFHHTLHYHLCLLPQTNTGTLPSARTSDV